jgi:hypothetical protein
LSGRYDTFQVIWARYASQTVLVTLLVLPNLRSVMRTAYPGLQLARSTLMFGATATGFFAFALMPLADATAIFETSPLIVTAFAALLLGEKVGWRRWIGGCGRLRRRADHPEAGARRVRLGGGAAAVHGGLLCRLCDRDALCRRE